MIRSYLALIAFSIGVPSILAFSSVTPQLRTLSSQRPSRAPFSSPTTTTTTRQYQTTTQKIATCLAASNKGNSGLETLRARLRDVTGFSFTAMRATLRASTGISLTAISASARATTSIVVTKMMKWFLDMFPTWSRYYVQPFLVLYYSPLLVLRSLGSKVRVESRPKLELQMKEWRAAVSEAYEANQDWPVYVNEEGLFRGVDETTDVAQGVMDSVLWKLGA